MTRRLDGALVRTLLDGGAISAAALESAVQHHANDSVAIDTILLERALVSEVVVRAALMSTWNEALDIRTAVIAPAAIAVLSERLARALAVVPIHLDEAGCLHVVSPSPPDRGLVDDVSALLQRSVQVHVALEVDVWRTFERAYGAPLDERNSSLGHALDAAIADGAQADADETLRPPAGEVELADWDLAEALAHLAQQRSRDDIAAVACRFARQFVPFAAMFGVREGQCHGWLRHGAADGEQFNALPLTVPAGSLLATTITSPSPWLGRPAQIQGNAVLLGWLGRRRPKTALVVPVVVRSRVVAAFYADSGVVQKSGSELAVLIAFASRLGAALEAVLRRRHVQPDGAPDGADVHPVTPPTIMDAPQLPRPLPSLVMASPAATSPSTGAFADDGQPHVWRFALEQAVERGLQGGESNSADLFDEATPIIRRVLDDRGWEDIRLSDLEGAQLSVAASPPVPAAVLGAVTLVASPGASTAALVDGLSSLDADEVRRSTAELIRRGAGCVPQLIERFPGRLRADPFDPADNARSPDQLSAVIEVIAGLGTAGLDAAIPHIESRYPAHRFAAVACFVVTTDARAIDLLRSRLHDPERRIRALALEALLPFLAHPRFESLLIHLRERLHSPLHESRERALDLLGRFRDVGSVPAMIALVEHAELGAAARQALRLVTLQDFGAKAKQWDKWWQKAKKKTRIDWLLEGLLSDELALRDLAHRELTSVASTDFGYRPDADAKDRQRAATVFFQWWVDTRPTQHLRQAALHSL